MPCHRVRGAERGGRHERAQPRPEPGPQAVEAGRRPARPGLHERSRSAACRRATTFMLYGWHTVKAALDNPARRIRKLYATENAARRLAADGVALR